MTLQHTRSKSLPNKENENHIDTLFFKSEEGLGIGVTAYGLEDAIDLIKSQDIAMAFKPIFDSYIKDVNLQDLDQNQYSEQTIITNIAQINKHEFIKYRLTKLIPADNSASKCPFRPSPFADTRYIDFEIPEKDSLQISLLDMLGNPLANILGYNLEAGCYSLYFEEANVNSTNYKTYFEFLSGQQESFVKTIIFSPGAKIN